MIKLNDKYLRRIEAFAAAVVSGNWHDFSSKPEHKELTSAIASIHGRYLSEENAKTIVLNELLSALSKSLAEAGTDSKISDINAANFKAVLQDNLIRRIESLPCRYLLSIAFPDFPSIGDFNIEISDNINLVSGRGKNALGQTGLNRLALLTFHSVTSKQTCLEIDLLGYGNESPESPAIAEGLSLAKQFAFLVTSHGIFERANSGSRSKAEVLSSERNFEVHIPDSVAKCFGNLKPDEEKWSVYDTEPKDGRPISLLGGSFRPPITNEEKLTALSEGLNNIKKFFSLRDHPDYSSIAAAMEWHQDSLFAENQTYAYLAACIGLEALLGSDGQLDLMSKRLADRYAYLVGKSKSDREKLILEYEKVLKLRGQLVHARQPRLKGEDQETLRLAQHMLLNVTWREMQQLLRD